MASSSRWTRRSFVRSLGSLSALGSFASVAPWASAAATRNARLSLSPRFGFIASAENAIHVFSITRNGAWMPRQTVSSASPASLTLSPDQRFLYVANAVDSFDHLPTGSVEAYAVDQQNGSLTLLNRQALALSGTGPKHLAVSPDGRQLAVAVAGGAAYNLLPINDDGTIAHVTASLKQVGRGPKPESQGKAKPHAVLFGSNEVVLAADMGSDRISAFSVDQDHALALNEHQAAKAGSGPAHLVAHPGGELFYVAGGLEAVVSSLRYRAGALRPVQQVQLAATNGGITALAMHRSGSLLFAADRAGISVGRVDASGAFEVRSRYSEGMKDVVALAASSDGARLFALSGSEHTMTSFAIDLESARLASPVDVATVARPLAIALKHT